MYPLFFLTFLQFIPDSKTLVPVKVIKQGIVGFCVLIFIE